MYQKNSHGEEKVIQCSRRTHLIDYYLKRYRQSAVPVDKNVCDKCERIDQLVDWRRGQYPPVVSTD